MEDAALDHRVLPRRAGGLTCIEVLLFAIARERWDGRGAPDARRRRDAGRRPHRPLRAVPGLAPCGPTCARRERGLRG
ncbi:MAG: hypothetical protein R3F43_06225 [bacterium]